MHDDVRYLIVSEAGKMLGLTPSGVRRLELCGQLRATRTPSGVRLFRAEDVARLAAERAARAAERGAR